MRHTFVIHLTTETGDVDPEELMADFEAFVVDSLPGVGFGGFDHRAEVEYVDAWEAEPLDELHGVAR